MELVAEVRCDEEDRRGKYGHEGGLADLFFLGWAVESSRVLSVSFPLSHVRLQKRPAFMCN